MANFKTHLTVGITTSSLAALAGYDRGLGDANHMQWLCLIGVAASLLPDIDVRNSKPMRGVFLALGASAGYLIVKALPLQLTHLEYAVLWALVWLAISQTLPVLFMRFTVHRGIWHSLLMALVIAVSGTLIAAEVFGQTAHLSWLVAGFVLIGYLTHLTLDELASVDVFGNRLKRSFGTALKPFSWRNWPASLFLCGWLYFLLGFAPLPPTPVWQAFNSIGMDAQWLVAHWPQWSVNYWTAWQRLLTTVIIPFPLTPC